MKIGCQNRAVAGMKLRTFIIDHKTGQVQKVSPWHHNTIMNQGLNLLAAGKGFAGIMSEIFVGASNTQNYAHNVSITFTQSGSTITASGAFFTSGMVGQLFKYGTGTGGAEYYITAYTDSTHVTVDTSATVSSASQGTVWNVTQTNLVSPLFTSTLVLADAGNGTVIASPGVIQLTCKYQFAVQGSPYTVNEIGYGFSSGTMAGRVVLGSSDVVPTTSFYVVQCVMTYTVSPCAAAAAFPNTGTNINVAGNGIYNTYSCTAIAATTGAPTTYQQIVGGSQSALMDSLNLIMVVNTTSFSLPSAISTGASSGISGSFIQLTGQLGFTQSGIGISTCSGSFNVTTSGQTAYGFTIGGFSAGGVLNLTQFQLLFTTPQTLPSGSFQGTFAWQNVFSRTLSNP